MTEMYVEGKSVVRVLSSSHPNVSCGLCEAE